MSKKAHSMVLFVQIVCEDFDQSVMAVSINLAIHAKLSFLIGCSVVEEG